MSKTFATYLELECGEGWNCKRPANKVDANWQDHYRYEDDPASRFRLSLRCNIHVGARKRQKWGRLHTFVPASDFPEMVALVLEARAKDRQEDIARGEVERVERALAEQANFAQEWVDRSTESPFLIEVNTEHRSYSDMFRAGYIVRKEDESADSWNSNKVDIEQNGNAPATVRIRSNGNMSPNKARALAQALILAANKAEERDITNGPA